MINSPEHDVVEACYLFYYASDAAFTPGEDTEAKLKKRLGQLMGDALIIASRAKFDVFNALSLMDNMTFLRDLKVSSWETRFAFLCLVSYGFKFGEGDGFLNFYLYNWRTSAMGGASADSGAHAGRGVGVVML